jgi:hypothetical protein
MPTARLKYTGNLPTGSNEIVLAELSPMKVAAAGLKWLVAEPYCDQDGSLVLYEYIGGAWTEFRELAVSAVTGETGLQEFYIENRNGVRLSWKNGGTNQTSFEIAMAVTSRRDAAFANILVMLTVGVNNTVNITDLTLSADSVTIYWGDGASDEYGVGSNNPTHTYSDGEPSHDIVVVGSLGAITALDAHDCDLSTMSGLFRLTSLVTLYLHNNSLTDIGDLSGLTSLTYLNLSNNSLTDIGDLSGLTSLTYLNLSNNGLTDIGDLSGLTSLTYLNLSNNSLTDIGDLSGLTSLTYLYLHINSLTDIGDLSGLTSLTYLNLFNNGLTDIGDLSGLTSLTYLYLSNNSLTDIGDLSGLTSLTYLNLSDNGLSQALVDGYLEDIASTIGSRPVAAYYFHGTNSAPSVPDGCDDYDTIVAHGDTILITGSCP